MKQGFTLMELLVTVIILSILASVSLPQYTRAVNRARLAEAVVNMANIQKGIDMYRTQFKGDNPTFLITGGTRLDVDLTGALSCTASGCSSRFFDYSASCTGESCTVEISSCSGCPGSDVLPTLTATRSKTGLSVTWTKSCAGGYDAGSALCAGLKSQGFTTGS